MDCVCDAKWLFFLSAGFALGYCVALLLCDGHLPDSVRQDRQNEGDGDGG